MLSHYYAMLLMLLIALSACRQLRYVARHIICLPSRYADAITPPLLRAMLIFMFRLHTHYAAC